MPENNTPAAAVTADTITEDEIRRLGDNHLIGEGDELHALRHLRRAPGRTGSYAKSAAHCAAVLNENPQHMDFMRGWNPPAVQPRLEIASFSRCGQTGRVLACVGLVSGTAGTDDPTEQRAIIERLLTAR